MAHTAIRRLLAWTLCGIPLTLMGCRQTEPADPYARDLGTGGTVLLPTASVKTVAKIAEGKAEWTNLRDPDTAPPTAGAAPDAQPDADTSASPLEEDVRAVIEEYNEVVADESATLEDILEYFVEAQRPALQPLLEAVRHVQATLKELRAQLETQKPDAGERIAAALNALDASTQLRLTVESLTVESDTSVTLHATTGPVGADYRLVLVDEDWFVEVPNVQALSQLQPILDLGVSTYRGWLDGLKAGTTSPDDVLTKLEAAAKTAQALTPSPGDDKSLTPGGTGAPPGAASVGTAPGAAPAGTALDAPAPAGEPAATPDDDDGGDGND